MTHTNGERELLRRAFSSSLKNLRDRTGIAQEKLAWQSGIDRGYMSGLERGLHSPTLETIFKFLPALGVTFTEFAQEFDICLKRLRRSPKKRESVD